MRNVLKEVQGKLEEARNTKDVVKLNCVNEKLTQIKEQGEHDHYEFFRRVFMGTHDGFNGYPDVWALSPQHPDWVGYLVLNRGKWQRSTIFKVPAHSLVHVTIYQFDGDSGLR